MPSAFLDDRGLLRIAGQDARSFLQGLVTCDMDKISPQAAGFGALLTPQGKILFDFVASLGRVDHDPERPPAIYLETIGVAAADFAKEGGNNVVPTNGISEPV